MVTALVQGFCTAAVMAASGCDQRQPLAPGISAAVRAQVDTSLAPVADAHLRVDRPNSNQGASLTLEVSFPGKNRALLTWDTASIRQAVAGGTLDSARLELTISQADNNWGAAGRTINLHRMTQAWTEAGATWNCAVDAIPGNQTHDCTGATVWQMGNGCKAEQMWPDDRAVKRSPATATTTDGRSARQWLSRSRRSPGGLDRMSLPVCRTVADAVA